MEGRRFFLCFSVICILIPAFVSAQVDTKDYVFELIDVPDSYSTGVFSINAQGQVAGRYGLDVGDCMPQAHSFIWKDGEFSYFSFEGAEGVYETRADGINERGDITGSYTLDPPVYDPVENRCYARRYGYVITHQGENLTVTFPFSQHEVVNKILPSGWMVGPFVDADCELPWGPNGCIHSFLLKEEEFYQLDFPGGWRTDVIDINPRGDFVGNYSDDTGRAGFVYHVGKDGYESIRFPGATETNAYSVNAAGHVLGNANHNQDWRVCYIYRQGHFTEINFIGGEGFSFSMWGGINPAGTVAGNARCPDGKDRAFIAWPVEED